MSPTGPTFAPLSWTEGDALEPFWLAQSGGFPTPEDFALWREWTLARLMVGELRCFGAKRDGRLVGGLLAECHGDHVLVQRVLGHLDDQALAGVIGAIRAQAGSIVLEEAVGRDWVARAGACGLSSFAHQGFTLDLTRLAQAPAPSPEGLAVRPWEAGDREPVIRVLSEANAGTLNGLFLTRPHPTDEAGCARALDAILAGRSGAFLPWASFVATREGRVVGAVLVVREGERANVFELAVLPDAQGRRVPRMLTNAVRRAVLDHGETELHLATTTENPAVHRLFHDDEVIHFAQGWGAYWLKQPRRRPVAAAPQG